MVLLTPLPILWWMMLPSPASENSWYLKKRKLGGVKVHRVKGYPSLFPRRF
jgi:hypothetical protein